jgi:hypothetical protein
MGAKAGPLLALLVVSLLLADLFRGGSTRKDKLTIIAVFLIVLAFVIWFYIVYP